jgi:hypothetical protein
MCNVGFIGTCALLEELEKTVNKHNQNDQFSPGIFNRKCISTTELTCKIKGKAVPVTGREGL